MAIREWTTFILLLNFWSLGKTVFFNRPPALGTLTPQNPEVCTGHSFTLNCTLFSVTNGNASDLVFTYNGSDVQAENTMVTSVFSRTFTVDRVSVYDNNAWVRCCLRNCSEYLNTVESQILMVVDQPTNVTDFRCMAYDWDTSLTCQWRLQKLLKPYHNFTCLWRYKGLSTPDWRACPALAPNSSLSQWDGSNDQEYFDGKRLEVQLYMANNGCEAAVVQMFTVVVSEVVKPAPVINLDTIVINSTCVTLTWGHGKPNHFKEFQVSYQAVNGRGGNWAEVVQGTSAMLCSLFPYTEYHFQVKVHSNSTKGYWSDGVNITATTEPDVPARAPKIANSSFLLVESECPSRRHVTIYWKPLTEFEANGPSPKVRVDVNPPVARGYRNLLDSDAQVTLGLLCDQTYTVNFWSFNDERFLSEATTLYIPRAGQDLPVLDFKKIEMETSGSPDVIHFEWENVFGLKDHSGFRYCLYWCPKSAGICAGEADWVIIDPPTTNLTLRMDRPEENVYGLAIETQESGGITWNSCIYTRGAVPGVVTDILVSPGADDNTLYITWKPLPCISGSPFITEYRLYHCGLSTSKLCEVDEYISIPANQSSWTLRELQPNKEYEVRLQAVAALKDGPISEAVFGTPTSRSFPVWGIILLAVAGVSLLVVVLFFILKFKNDCQRRSRKNVEINEDLFRDIPAGSRGATNVQPPSGALESYARVGLQDVERRSLSEGESDSSSGSTNSGNAMLLPTTSRNNQEREAAARQPPLSTTTNLHQYSSDDYVQQTTCLISTAAHPSVDVSHNIAATATPSGYIRATSPNMTTVSHLVSESSVIVTATSLSEYVQTTHPNLTSPLHLGDVPLDIVTSPPSEYIRTTHPNLTSAHHTGHVPLDIVTSPPSEYIWTTHPNLTSAHHTGHVPLDIVTSPPSEYIRTTHPNLTSAHHSGDAPLDIVTSLPPEYIQATHPNVNSTTQPFSSGHHEEKYTSSLDRDAQIHKASPSVELYTTVTEVVPMAENTYMTDNMSNTYQSMHDKSSNETKVSQCGAVTSSCDLPGPVDYVKATLDQQNTFLFADRLETSSGLPTVDTANIFDVRTSENTECVSTEFAEKNSSSISGVQLTPSTSITDTETKTNRDCVERSPSSNLEEMQGTPPSDTVYVTDDFAENKRSLTLIVQPPSSPSRNMPGDSTDVETSSPGAHVTTYTDGTMRPSSSSRFLSSSTMSLATSPVNNNVSTDMALGTLPTPRLNADLVSNNIPGGSSTSPTSSQPETHYISHTSCGIAGTVQSSSVYVSAEMATGFITSTVPHQTTPSHRPNVSSTGYVSTEMATTPVVSDVCSQSAPHNRTSERPSGSGLSVMAPGALPASASFQTTPPILLPYSSRTVHSRGGMHNDTGTSTASPGHAQAPRPNTTAVHSSSLASSDTTATFPSPEYVEMTQL